MRKWGKDFFELRLIVKADNEYLFAGYLDNGLEIALPFTYASPHAPIKLRDMIDGCDSGCYRGRSVDIKNGWGFPLTTESLWALSTWQRNEVDCSVASPAARGHGGLPKK